MADLYGQDLINHLIEMDEKNKATYPKGIEFRYCPYCGWTIEYDTEAYHRGYHINCV